ncbi:hypothetical protein E5720_12260 [Rhodococcus sp. PAMC28707]|uniref:hypothetical protein n=1 Tax=unclassified Rhodococcus (in: high G+C Gram-positive bacteria) TaxID=192944 RepID=UPI00109E0C16|nr:MULTISPECIES: hypothetical protein [unclassified Rhodococcus (in: high G+C Gram-positive bacteria)]QCB49155.1 hypothetical protein E5769_01755 [Rhodococcus sp. PAMC28705]QCB59157.1 hypothetical protein E5720_12260 [Rhodococcus sp. PAMC28707]
MSDSLKARLRVKLIGQLTDDGDTDLDRAEGDNPRLVSISDDLAALDEVAENDPLVEELAMKYWVP